MFVEKCTSKKKSEINLSVIIPIYNAQETIGELLKDIKNQKFNNFEVLMIDDGSTDHSGIICKKFETEDSRYHYIYQDNKGVSAARNLGIRESKGRYITFLDSDDRIPSNRFFRMIEEMEKKETIDLVSGRYGIQEDKGKFPYSHWQSELIGVQSRDVLIKDYAKSLEGFYYGVIWNKLYKKRIIIEQNIKFDESLSWGEDLLFNLQYFRHIRFCAYLEEDIYTYCYTETSLLSNDKIYQEKIDFIRYENIIQLGNMLPEKDYRVYAKYADVFLLKSAIRQMGMKASVAGFRNQQTYESFVRYILSPELSFLWETDALFKTSIIYYFIQKLILKKQYCLLYYIFIIKERMKKNCVWKHLKEVRMKEN